MPHAWASSMEQGRQGVCVCVRGLGWTLTSVVVLFYVPTLSLVCWAHQDKCLGQAWPHCCRAWSKARQCFPVGGGITEWGMGRTAGGGDGLGLHAMPCCCWSTCAADYRYISRVSTAVLCTHLVTRVPRPVPIVSCMRPPHQPGRCGAADNLYTHPACDVTLCRQPAVCTYSCQPVSVVPL